MKKFAIPGDQIQRIISPMGGCLATDRILVDGKKVGYMYREITERAEDSGWRFFAGDESQEYIDDISHTAIYDVNTIANYDRDIIQYLQVPPPCAFDRVKGTHNFVAVAPPSEPWD
jgi:hypothetical protein